MYDVGSPYPGGEEAPKGLAVRQLKGYARKSRVQIVISGASQICLFMLKLSKHIL